LILKNAILIEHGENGALAAVLKDGEVHRFAHCAEETHAGDVRLGRVRNIVSKRFAFLDVGLGKDAFLQTDDPKNAGAKLRAGAELPVFVEREQTAEKGACVTAELEFDGILAALLKRADKDEPPKVMVSKKISDEGERARLKRVCAELLPAGFGVIARTAAAAASDEAVRGEIASLLARCESVLKDAKGARAPKLLSGGEHPAKSLILRLAKKETEKILIESKDFAKIAGDLELAPFGGVLEEYAGGAPLFSFCGADKALEEALRRKVWLPSGGFLLIEQGEACAFIDVNSGKAGGRSSFKVNIEAARETARQARLRNLSGRIAVDFITPESAAEASELREAFAEALSLDDERASIDIADKWGVYLLTRPKRGAALRDALTKPCPCCGGGGRTREGRVKEPRS
jgi:ribonuclease G